MPAAALRVLAPAADPTKLVIFFQGGGGCWDAETRAVGSGWFDDRVGFEDDPQHASGLLDTSTAANPFRELVVRLRPVLHRRCLHGDRDASYGQGVRVRHRGAINARAVLAGAFEEFPSARSILVAAVRAASARRTTSAASSPAIRTRA